MNREEKIANFRCYFCRSTNRPPPRLIHTIEDELCCEVCLNKRPTYRGFVCRSCDVVKRVSDGKCDDCWEAYRENYNNRAR